MTNQEDSMQKDINILELIDSKIARYFNKSMYISDFIYDLESYIIKCDGGHFEYCQEYELEELPQ